MTLIPQNSSTATPLVNGAEQPIARLGSALTAFVGRTLRGPINQPTIINSFTEFQQEFGGLWQPSMLSYAVEQFFDQGGRQAIVVRVANESHGVAGAGTIRDIAGRTLLCHRIR